MPGCGVALCESSEARSRDLARLGELLAKSDLTPFRCETDPFSDPDGVQDFVKSANLTSLVVAGTCKSGSLAEVARAAESAGIPRFAIQTVRLRVYGSCGGGSISETWALAVATH